MKNVLLFIILNFSCLCVRGQFIITKKNNLPRSGDCLVKQQVSFVNPAETDSTFLLDLRELVPIDKNYQLKYYKKGDSIVAREHNTLYYYVEKNNILYCVGFENPLMLLSYAIPEQILAFPFANKQKITNSFDGKETYCDKQHFHVFGKTSTKSEAVGQIILPDGDTLCHVSRIHTKNIIDEQAITENVTSCSSFVNDSIDNHLQNDSIIVKDEIWKWFADGYRYPIFESIKNSVTKQGINPQEYFSVSLFCN